jgi:hypothetical protein
MRFGRGANPATRQSWANAPMPEKRSRLVLRREFTGGEYGAIRHGLIPEQMEDKWFIFLEGDTLYFHRSWTGHCIYQLTLTREGAKYAVSDALVNRDAAQYAGADDAYDERLLTYLIDNLLLGGRAVLPTPKGIAAGIQTDLHHHHVAGAQRKGAEAPGEKRKRGWLWRWLMRG